MVKGSTAQFKHVDGGIGASLKVLISGKVKAYSEKFNEERAVAAERMTKAAKGFGAAAIAAVRHSRALSVTGQLRLG